jgi:hypothetical protein
VPGLAHLLEKLAVGMLRLQVGALADVSRARDPEHVEQVGNKDVEPEHCEPVRVDLVVGREARGVVGHHDAGPMTGAFRVRHVAGNAILLLRELACDDSHLRSSFSVSHAGVWILAGHPAGYIMDRAILRSRLREGSCFSRTNG